MNIANDISQLLNSPSLVPEQQWVDEARKQYPYFSLPLLLMVKRSKGSTSDEALQRLAIMSPDRRDLAITTGSAPQAFANFYPSDNSHGTTPDTDAAIDKFLATYGNGSSKHEIDALSKAIFNPTPDYADILAAQQPSDGTHLPQSKEDELISSFIEHSRKQEREAMDLQPATEQHVLAEQAQQVAHDAIEQSTLHDDSMLSESLAKMYIARGKYSKALEIIESINLNFPEKSIYFADQIRFLRKLVLNETIKNKL